MSDLRRSESGKFTLTVEASREKERHRNHQQGRASGLVLASVLGNFPAKRKFREVREKQPPDLQRKKEGAPARDDHQWSPASARGIGRAARGAYPLEPNAQRVTSYQEPNCPGNVIYQRLIVRPVAST